MAVMSETKQIAKAYRSLITKNAVKNVKFSLAFLQLLRVVG